LVAATEASCGSSLEQVRDSAEAWQP
jgi:hypothetical protein